MQHLSRDEIKRLVLELSDYRQRLIVLIGFYHGLRVSETLALTGKDIQDGFVNVQRLKGSLKTIQPFVHSDDPVMDEAAPLTMLAQTAGLREKLFKITRNGVYKMMQRAGTKAGIPRHKLHPHALKHSCAMAGIGVLGIHELKNYLGHRSLNSTSAYLEADQSKVFGKMAEVFNRKD